MLCLEKCSGVEGVKVKIGLKAIIEYMGEKRKEFLYFQGELQGFWSLRSAFQSILVECKSVNCRW